MKITKTFELKPVVRDGVVQVQWGIVGTVEDEKMRARWNAFSAKRCAGRDATGKYYDSKKHANEVIKAFKEKERLRPPPAIPTPLLPSTRSA